MEKNKIKILSFIKSNIDNLTLSFIAVSMLLFSVISSNYAELPIYINSVEDFANIEKTGMDKYYIITGYLTFENWIPLGSEENPFTGKLESKNPISIKSFNSNSKGDVGLFAVNKGVILGIKVYNPSITQTFSGVETFGYFAGINRGKITSCNVYAGNSKLNFDDANIVSVGVFAGINYGDIRKCITTNQVTINGSELLNFGNMCGESRSGMIELNSAKASSYLYSKSLNGGGLCGVSNNSIFINNFVKNTMHANTIDSSNVGGFIGKTTNVKNEIINSYNDMVVEIDTLATDLKIGSVGFDEGTESSFKNCVTNMRVSSRYLNFTYGTFFTDDSHKLIDNCYYINFVNSEKAYYQGTRTSFCELSLTVLNWDSAIWRVSCLGIESIIVYEK